MERLKTMPDESKNIEKSIESAKEHLSETIDAFMTKAKQKTHITSNKSLKIVGISVAVVAVVVLLKKDKAMTKEYLALIEDASSLKTKYDKLFKDHLDSTETYLDLLERHLDLCAYLAGITPPKLVSS